MKHFRLENQSPRLPSRKTLGKPLKKRTGGSGGKEANPNPILVTSLGRREGGVREGVTTSPKPPNKFEAWGREGREEREGRNYPSKPNPSPLYFFFQKKFFILFFFERVLLLNCLIIFGVSSFFPFFFF